MMSKSRRKIYKMYPIIDGNIVMPLATRTHEMLKKHVGFENAIRVRELCVEIQVCWTRCSMVKKCIQENYLYWPGVLMAIPRVSNEAKGGFCFAGNADEVRKYREYLVGLKTEEDCGARRLSLMQAADLEAFDAYVLKTFDLTRGVINVHSQEGA